MSSPINLASRFTAILAEYQLLIFFVALAVLSRVLPHPENITPLAATGLFAGAYFNNRLYLAAPVLAAVISDLLGPGVYNLLVMATVYIGLLVSSLAGRYLLHNRQKILRLPIAVIVAAFSFYLITNLSAWWVYYPHTLEGLISCYVNGIPYLGRTLLGDTFYSLIFFGSYELLLKRQRQPDLS